MASSQQAELLALIPSPVDRPFPYITCVVLFFLAFCVVGRDKSQDVPILNPKKTFEFSDKRRINEFISSAEELLLKGKKQYPGQPYKLFSTDGELIILPTHLIDELKNKQAISLINSARDDLFYPTHGFEPFYSGENFVILIRRHLTRILVKMTKPLSEETAFALEDGFGHSPEWIEVSASERLFPIVAQLSNRIFMGEGPCRDKAWTAASASFAHVAFSAAWVLRAWPRSLRPIVHWFLPAVRNLRAELQKCRAILKPYLDARAAAKADAAAQGKPAPDFDDSFEWFDGIYKNNYDAAALQIGLGVVALHTTTDLIEQAMVQIAKHPELFAPLREETVRVLSEHGLSKTGLNELHLVDSMFKEAMRLKPTQLSTMRRMVNEDVTLSTGLVLRKGQKIAFDNTHMRESEFFENPDKFDLWRFERMRHIPGKEHMVPLSATGPESLGFGHGQRGCPGRFFAANLVKIVFAHLILKYDWTLAGHSPKNQHLGFALIGDPNTKFMIRRRKEEVDFDNIQVV